jgi:hypothetical protein
VTGRLPAGRIRIFTENFAFALMVEVRSGLALTALAQVIGLEEHCSGWWAASPLYSRRVRSQAILVCTLSR